MYISDFQIDKEKNTGTVRLESEELDSHIEITLDKKEWWDLEKMIRKQYKGKIERKV